MKLRPCFLVLTILMLAFLFSSVAEETKPAAPRFEFVTIRWAGRDNTHIIRNGQVEFIGMELRKVPKPDRADERSFYMNLAMNGLAKEGFDFSGMTPDEIVMKRRLLETK